MIDLDEGIHALQNLDAQGRKALVLAGELWKEIYRDENQHGPASHIVSRYLTELGELSEEGRELRRRLDEALDGREAAEALLDRERWQHSLHHREPLTPPCWDDERIDLLETEVRRLRRLLKSAREGEHVAVDRMQQARLRTEAAEQRCEALRSELRAVSHWQGKGQP